MPSCLKTAVPASSGAVVVAAPFFGSVTNNPLGNDMTNSIPGTYTADNAAVIQLDLGSLGPYESVTFPVFFAGDDTSDNLRESIERAVSTTYIEVSDPSETNAVFALGSGSLNLETPTDVTQEGKEHFQTNTDAKSIMIGHL